MVWSQQLSSLVQLGQAGFVISATPDDFDNRGNINPVSTVYSDVSLAAVAIAPESDLDRVYINYTPVSASWGGQILLGISPGAPWAYPIQKPVIDPPGTPDTPSSFSTNNAIIFDVENAFKGAGVMAWYRTATTFNPSGYTAAAKISCFFQPPSASLPKARTPLRLASEANFTFTGTDTVLLRRPYYGRAFLSAVVVAPSANTNTITVKIWGVNFRQSSANPNPVDRTLLHTTAALAAGSNEAVEKQYKAFDAIEITGTVGGGTQGVILYLTLADMTIF